MAHARPDLEVGLRERCLHRLGVTQRHERVALAPERGDRAVERDEAMVKPALGAAGGGDRGDGAAHPRRGLERAPAQAVGQVARRQAKVRDERRVAGGDQQRADQRQRQHELRDVAHARQRERLGKADRAEACGASRTSEWTPSWRSATAVATAPPSEWPTSVHSSIPSRFSPAATSSAYALMRGRSGRSEPPNPGRSTAMQGRCVSSASPVQPSESSSRPCSSTSGRPSPGQLRTLNRRPPASRTSRTSGARMVPISSARPVGIASLGEEWRRAAGSSRIPQAAM